MSRPSSSPRLRFLLLAAMLALVVPALRAQFVLGPTPYLSFADSPFNSLGVVSYFHLETFEDDLLNTPGVTANNGSVVGAEDWGSLIDSVDFDDGLIDGLGNGGRDFFNTSGSVTFTFNAGILGTLPTHVGIVWTDGGNPTFEAFDSAGGLLGSVSASSADGNNSGGTAEDRFLGLIYAGGIGSIKVTAASWELDHLQYGVLQAVPEPGTWQLLVAGSGLTAGFWLRRRRSGSPRG